VIKDMFREAGNPLDTPVTSVTEFNASAAQLHSMVFEPGMDIELDTAPGLHNV